LNMNQFSDLSLSHPIHQNLARNCFLEPTPVQAQTIPAALRGDDVIATAQTGTGKTLAFLLPILDRLLKASRLDEHQSRRGRIEALVVTPTRELAIQIADTFSKLVVNTGLRSAVVVGGVSEQSQLNAIGRGAQLVIATPGRLVDFLDRGLVNLSSVEVLVLDEADRMLDMGFLPAVERILSILPASRQSLFFSATMDQGVDRLIQRHSRSPVRIAVGGSSMKIAGQIDLHVYEVENDLKVDLLRHMLDREAGSFLVFARTKHGTDRLAKRLSGLGLRAAAIHGDRTQSQRNQALSGFRDGRYRVLVATDVAARGIHVDSVAHVVNYDLPQAPTDFIHRAGRTGRAGQRGCASTFSLKSERDQIRRIERECKVRLTRQEVSPEIVKRASQPSGPEGCRSSEPKARAGVDSGRSPAPSKRKFQPRSGRKR
jgi:ATP-dependent RNA helicase RhlE